jgi:hypothetical protein
MSKLPPISPLHVFTLPLLRQHAFARGWPPARYAAFALARAAAPTAELAGSAASASSADVAESASASDTPVAGAGYASAPALPALSCQAFIEAMFIAFR